MIKFPLIVWFDVNRVLPEAVRAAMKRKPDWIWIPQIGSTPAIGIVAHPVPTPDQLFRWKPKPPRRYVEPKLDVNGTLIEDR